MRRCSGEFHLKTSIEIAVNHRTMQAARAVSAQPCLPAQTKMFRSEKNLSRILICALLSCCLSAAHAEPLGCLIEPDRVAEVGSQSVGVLDQVRVERGDLVKEGQILARLSTDIERASVAVAETRAKAEAELKGAEAASMLAKRKYERARELVRQRYISDQALDQALAEAHVAAERARQAREARNVAERELQLSTAQLSQRFIRSPFDGIVVERYHTVGERIEREAVVKIAKIDPLRIEVIVPASQFGAIHAGQTAPVTPQLPQFGTLTATVTLVDRVIDAASNSFRVRLALPNPDHRVPSGLRCSVDFALATEAPKTLPGLPSGSSAPKYDDPLPSSLPAKPRMSAPTLKPSAAAPRLAPPSPALNRRDAALARPASAGRITPASTTPSAAQDLPLTMSTSLQSGRR